MKDFYIVPSLTNPSSYYDKVAADTKEDALIGFKNSRVLAGSMDMDMSAYFKAVESVPIQGIHSYEYPDGDFAVAMSIIADTMNGNEKSVYYDKDALDGLTINVDELASPLTQRTMMTVSCVSRSLAMIYGEPKTHLMQRESNGNGMTAGDLLSPIWTQNRRLPFWKKKVIRQI